MTTSQLAAALPFEVLSDGGGVDRPITGIYCCDLLSLVMGQAQAGDAWITVMGNLNAIAVAVLAELPCIVLAHQANLPQPCIDKAIEEHIWILRSDQAVYPIAQQIAQAIPL